MMADELIDLGCDCPSRLQTRTATSIWSEYPALEHQTDAENCTPVQAANNV
jgi:hypothetical protein